MDSKEQNEKKKEPKAYSRWFTVHPPGLDQKITEILSEPSEDEDEDD